MYVFLFLLIIIIALAWPFLKFGFKVRNMQRDFARAAREARQQWDRGSGRHGHRGGAPRRKAKVYGRDEGEYVEFTEVSQSETSGEPRRSAPTPHEVEEQVSEAEWEEIR